MLINISTIGGQVMPIYQGLVYSKPDKMYLIHSPDSLNQANVLVQNYSCEYELVEVEPLNFKDITEAVSDIAKEHINDIFFINSTGGTKIMSLAIVNVFAQTENSTLAYFDQNGNILELNTGITKPVIIDFIKTETVFELSGNKLTHFEKLSDFEKDDFAIIDKIRKSNFITKIVEVAKLGNIAQKDHKPLAHSFPNGTNYEFDKITHSLTIEIYNKYNKKESYVFIAKHAISLVLNTGWFELEMASLFEKWKFTKEIILNAKVPYKTGSDKNEIDIVVNLGSKLLFVECKVQISDIKDVDKFNNVIKTYGGLGAKGIIILDQIPNARVVEKCKDNHILLFSLENVRKNKEKITIEKGLFNFLEPEIHQSNLR